MRSTFKWGFLLVVLCVTLGSAWAELRKGEKLIPFALKSIDDAAVTLKLEKERLVVTKESVKDGKKKVKRIYPDAVLLDFWATWCPPCRLSVPHLQKLHVKYFEKLLSEDERKADEKKGGLVVVGVSLDRSGSRAVKPFAKKMKLTYLLLADPVRKSGSGKKLITDPKRAAAAYKVSGIPTMYLLDSKGVIRSVYVGFAPSVGEKIEEEVKRLVKLR